MLFQYLLHHLLTTISLPPLPVLSNDLKTINSEERTFISFVYNSSSDDGLDPSLVNLTSVPGNTEFTKRVSFLIIPPGFGKSKSIPPYNNYR